MQLTMPIEKEKFVIMRSKPKLRKFLTDEYEYISNLLVSLDVPDSVHDDKLDELFLKNTKNLTKKPLPAAKQQQKPDQTADVHQRLEIMKNKMQSKKSKPSERTIKKRQLKKLKKDKEFKKRVISVAKSTKNEQIKEEKFLADNKDLVKPVVFNENKKLVFSKFEFSAQPSKAKKPKNKKIEKNPKLVLQKLKKQQKEVKELIDQGEHEKATDIQKDLAWKKAFDKTEGVKIKDNTTLLHKTIKRNKDLKKKSKLDWKKREEKVEKDIESRQKKRQENINKKKDEKRKNKLKKMAKRGRIIPGY